jgi:hypothetical protein
LRVQVENEDDFPEDCPPAVVEETNAYLASDD